MKYFLVKTRWLPKDEKLAAKVEFQDLAGS
jgi:hypothetical protein